MLKKVKISVKDSDVRVLVPYKNGRVEWQVCWVHSYGFSFEMSGLPDIYQRNKVLKMQREFLQGVWLHKQIIRHLAASHEWVLMRRFKGALDYRYKTREMERAAKVASDNDYE